MKNCKYLDDKSKKIKLINLHKIKEIYSTYVEIIKNNGLEMQDGIINEDYINSEDEDYEDDENSNSESCEESEENKDNLLAENINDKNIKDPSDDEGDNKEKDWDILELFNNVKKNKTNINLNQKKIKIVKVIIKRMIISIYLILIIYINLKEIIIK